MSTMLNKNYPNLFNPTRNGLPTKFLFAILFTFLQPVNVASPVMCSNALPKSVAFVLDDTGSMTDPINSIKELVNNKQAALDNVVDRFILVIFNDPANLTTLVINTDDITSFVSTVSDIMACCCGRAECCLSCGGDELPESSMSGLLMAAQASNDFGDIVLFTDATASDFDTMAQATAMVQAKNLKVHFACFADCGGEKAAGSNYQTIAASTGGAVIDTTAAADLEKLMNDLTNDDCASVSCTGDNCCVDQLNGHICLPQPIPPTQGPSTTIAPTTITSTAVATSIQTSTKKHDDDDDDDDHHDDDDDHHDDDDDRRHHHGHRCGHCRHKCNCERCCPVCCGKKHKKKHC